MRAREKKEINVTVGRNIRIHRERAGYTRERLAELIEVSPRFLYDAECGAVGVSLTTLRRICETLGVSADAVLWPGDSREPSLAERLAHVDGRYVRVIEELIQKQLELLALASGGDDGKTRH